MHTTQVKLLEAATISTVDEYGAALIPKTSLTENLIAHIEKCKYKHEEHETGDILIFNPTHPDFA